MTIPRAFDAARSAIRIPLAQVARRQAANPNADVSAWEAETDAIVERLYFG